MSPDKFRSEQTAVLRGMGAGALVALALIVAGPGLHSLGYVEQGAEPRLRGFAMAVIPVLFFLALAIGRLAHHRFFHHEDIDPLGNAGSRAAQSLQNQLRNTLEQAVLAIGAYAVWYASIPGNWGHGPWLAAALFAAGRTLFFARYSSGSSARAFGFTMTFYPSLAVIGCSVLALYL